MNAPALPNDLDAASLLPLYDKARAALEICASVDEARHIRDEVTALVAYAHQRDDTRVAVYVQEIRLRASIRVGQLLGIFNSELCWVEEKQPCANAGTSLKTDAIATTGLSRRQAYRHQELADLVGTVDDNNRKIGERATDDYFARCRESNSPGTDAGLRDAIMDAVQAAMPDSEVRRRYRALLREDLAVKAERRAEREVRLGEKSIRASARLGTKLYAVIYADPPWRTEAWSADTGKGRAADNHYPTMTVEEICALQVPAAPNAVLFLWVPANLVPAGVRIVEAWGFDYSTHAVWEKPHPITGYWFRSVHELLFVATRGHDFVAPALGTQARSVIDAALDAREHSRKPEAFAELIERYYPTAPKLELFARRSRPGWDAWGNEIEPDDAPDSAGNDAADTTPDDGGAAPSDAGPLDRAERGAA